MKAKWVDSNNDCLHLASAETVAGDANPLHGMAAGFLRYHKGFLLLCQNIASSVITYAVLSAVLCPNVKYCKMKHEYPDGALVMVKN